jgi:hypothetical protein
VLAVVEYEIRKVVHFDPLNRLASFDGLFQPLDVQRLLAEHPVQFMQTLTGGIPACLAQRAPKWQ